MKTLSINKVTDLYGVARLEILGGFIGVNKVKGVMGVGQTTNCKLILLNCTLV